MQKNLKQIKEIKKKKGQTGTITPQCCSYDSNTNRSPRNTSKVIRANCKVNKVEWPKYLSMAN
jgi:predicted Zn-ribbon and HTH transcriptional regulator